MPKKFGTLLSRVVLLTGVGTRIIDTPAGFALRWA